MQVPSIQYDQSNSRECALIRIYMHESFHNSLFYFLTVSWGLQRAPIPLSYVFYIVHHCMHDCSQQVSILNTVFAGGRVFLFCFVVCCYLLPLILYYAIALKRNYHAAS